MQMSLKRMRLLGGLLILSVFLLDQGTKTMVLASHDAGDLPAEILPFFRIVLVWNAGISFGMLSHMPSWLHPDWAPLGLTVATSLIALFLAVWLTRARAWHVSLALGCIIGGAAGNIVDRIRFRAVEDFLDFHLGSLHWPAFNVADSAIFIGVVILVVMGIVKNPTVGN